MWCGASASTRIHETVRHTRRFDFDFSNSFSVVLSSAVWNMSSRKKSVFVLFCCRSLLWCQPALRDTFPGPCVLFFFCFVCFFSSVVCFISQVIWLVSESNFAPVSPCIPLHSQTYSHSHISPNWHAAFTLQTNQFFTWSASVKCGSSSQAWKCAGCC